MKSVDPRTLRGRLALWYGLMMVLVLTAFSAALYFAVDDEDEPEPAAAAVQEAPDLTPKRLLFALAVALPSAIGLAVGGGLWITRRSLKPLEEAVRIAGELGADRLSTRIPIEPGSPEEIANLIRSLNGMLARLENAVDGMRRFTADASHELRTPLAALMGEIEVTLRRQRDPDELRTALESTLEDLGRLNRLVESLLLLARADNGELPLERVSIDLGEAKRRLLDPYEQVMAERRISLKWSCPAPVRVRSDPMWIGRAMTNLIDNACKFTPPGGEIAVTVQATSSAAEILVGDSGPGVAVGERERIFERFYRGNQVRSAVEGFGLGLALARDIVRGLGGQLSLDDREASGALFRLELPLG